MLAGLGRAVRSMPPGDGRLRLLVGGRAARGRGDGRPSLSELQVSAAEHRSEKFSRWLGAAGRGDSPGDGTGGGRGKRAIRWWGRPRTPGAGVWRRLLRHRSRGCRLVRGPSSGVLQARGVVGELRGSVTK